MSLEIEASRSKDG
jgi:hypothetical protein